MKAFVFCLICFFSFPSLTLLSSKEQYQGFLEYQKRQKAFEGKRKKSFKKYQKNIRSYQRRQNQILRRHLRKRKKPVENSKAQQEWEKRKRA